MAAVVMVEAERDADNANITNLPDALWWAATTVTTGAMATGTRGPGRAVAVAVMVVGIALLSVVAASVAAFFLSRLQDV